MQLILLFLVIFTVTLPNIVHGTDYKDQLIALGQSIRLSEGQKADIDAQITTLKQDQHSLQNDILGQRYLLAKQHHQILSFERSSKRHAYLLPQTDYYDFYYDKRTYDNMEATLKIQIETHIQRLLDLEKKQADIQDYLDRKNRLNQTIQAGLSKLETMQKSRTSDLFFKNYINKLKEESKTLDEFLNTVLHLAPLPPDLSSLPIEFSMPVSGIIRRAAPPYQDGITIESQAGALITTPAAGHVIFAGSFNALGNIVIINHGQGYISILKNIGTIFVQEGFQLQKNEPIGTLPVKNNQKDGNTTMLYYELRYNDSIINPISKITGL